MQPKVSIIIPCHNHALYLDKAIKSCLNQTYKNNEIIVVNDGSTDKTEEVCKKYMDKILYLKNKKSLGVSAARNVGIKKAGGELISFLDADDTLFPWALENSVAALEANPKAGFSYCDHFVISKRDIPMWEHKTADFNLERFFNKPNICIGAFTVRREALDTAGYFDERLFRFEDYDLYRRLCVKYDGVRVAVPLFNYRLHFNFKRYANGAEYERSKKLCEKKAEKLKKRVSNPENIVFKPRIKAKDLFTLSCFRLMCLPRHTLFFLRGLGRD